MLIGHFAALFFSFLVLVSVLADPTAKTAADTRTLALAGAVIVITGDRLVTAWVNYMRR